MMRLLKEPLIQFLLVGAGLFSFQYLREERPQTIVLTQVQRQHLASEFSERAGRNPTPEELSQLVSEWHTSRALFLEGQRLGLLEEDPVIQRHVAERMLEALVAAQPQPPPSEGALREYWKLHKQDFDGAGNFDELRSALNLALQAEIQQKARQTAGKEVANRYRLVRE